MFDGAAERIVGTGSFLKREETLILVESVRTPEQALRTLDLIAKHLENRAAGQGGMVEQGAGGASAAEAGGSTGGDWHHRKKYYLRLCVLSAKMQRPEPILALFGNQKRFQVATYFAEEVIRRLAPMGVPAPWLMRVAELTKIQRGPADKGVRMAYKTLVEELSARGQEADQVLLAKAKADLKTLGKAAAAPPAPASAAPVTAAAAPAAPAASAAAPPSPESIAAVSA